MRQKPLRHSLSDLAHPTAPCEIPEVRHQDQTREEKAQIPHKITCIFTSILLVRASNKQTLIVDCCSRFEVYMYYGYLHKWDIDLVIHVL